MDIKFNILRKYTPKEWQIIIKIFIQLQTFFELSGPLGYGEPRINKYKIECNGVPYYSTFTFSNVLGKGEVNTGGKPYTQAVLAFLWAVHYVFPNNLAIKGKNTVKDEVLKLLGGTINVSK